MARVLILTEAGTGIGFGHFSRMQALTTALRRFGAKVEMRVHPGAHSDTRLSGLPWGSWWKAKSDDGDLVVVDSYRAPLQRYQQIKHQRRPLVVVDDFNRLNYPADLLVNPGFGAGEPYPLARTGRILVGPRYILLRHPFCAHHPRRHTDQQLSVLVTVGGQDPHNLLAPLARAAREVVGKVELVAGDESRRNRLRAHLPSDIRVHGKLGAVAMRNLMDRCALAVTAAGQTMHELSSRRTAMVAVLTGEDQRYNLEGYSEAEALLRPLRFDSDHLHSTVAQDVATLLDSHARSRQTKAAARLVDGRGASRVASAILCLK